MRTVAACPTMRDFPTERNRTGVARKKYGTRGLFHQDNSTGTDRRAVSPCELRKKSGGWQRHHGFIGGHHVMLRLRRSADEAFSVVD